MPYYDFFWTGPLIEHWAEHDVSTDDFEHVVRNPWKTTTSHSSGNPAALGFAPDWRLLWCVYEVLPDGTLMATTAYEIDPFGD